MEIQTLIVFVAVFGGMIFLHEFGHFIVARFFKIPVEEFGFGIPPRAWRFWRNKGHLFIGGKKVILPSNYDLPFDWQDGLNKAADATVDEVNGQLILRSIKLLVLDLELEASQEAEKPSSKVQRQGAIALSGVLTEIEPGMEWTINWLPLGGFVRPRGENDPDVPGGLAAANPWQRLAVLFAGPLMNLLTAIVVGSLFVSLSGISIPGTVMISEVMKNSPAQQAGLKNNDVVQSINGKKITESYELISIVRSNVDKPITIVVTRDGKPMTITATPLSTRLKAGQGALGVALDFATRPATTSEVLTGGVSMTATYSLGLLYLPVGLLQNTIAPEDARFVGLKGMYDMFGSAIQRDTESRAAINATPVSPSDPTGNSTPASSRPTNNVMLLIIMLSISLGVFNLLPIPALDGGRILFTMPEIIFRRRIPPRLENTINGVAFLLLIGLMIFVNAMDFINPVSMR